MPTSADFYRQPRIRSTPDPSICDLGVGCESFGTCYAAANCQPEKCGRRESSDEPAANLSPEDRAALRKYGIESVLRPAYEPDEESGDPA